MNNFRRKMKNWLITASSPICGTDTYFIAFCEEDPLDREDFPYQRITDDLWNNYSYLLHLDDEEYESPEDEDEAYAQAYIDWEAECNFSSEEISEEELQEYKSEEVIIRDDTINCKC